MDFKKNISNYYFYSTFCDLLILGPVLVLFLDRVKGLSFTEIMILQSISAIAIVFFEVPTGAVADIFSRKISILLGAILVGLSLLIYISGTHFIVFALAEITFSIGACLRSGADSALIYDSLKKLNMEKEYQRIEGKARSLSLYAQAFGSVIAGFVYEVHPYLPFIISIVFMAITGIAAMNFREPAVENRNKKVRTNYLSQIADSGRFIINHEKLKAVTIFCMVFFIFYRAGFWYFQPYMESVDIPVRYFGILFFVFNITAAFVSKRSHNIMEKTKPRTLTFMASLMILSFIIMAFVKIELGVLAILLQQMARGLYRPVTTKYLNKHIPSEKRATILSFQSLLSNLAVAITFPFMGILKDYTNIFTTHLVLGGVMLVLIVIITGYMNVRIGVGRSSEESC
jgi:MFS family permease